MEDTKRVVTKEKFDSMIKNHKAWLENNNLINDYAIDLRYADLSNTDLRGFDLSNIDFRNAKLSGADLRDVFLVNTNLEGANLNNANLTGAVLNYANLRSASLANAKLAYAKLDDADLTDACLSNADFSSAYMFKSILMNTNLSRANLFRADLQNANLRQAHLYFADLSFANLTYADIRGAYFQYTNMKGVIGIPMVCPSDGAFIGWKKTIDYINNSDAIVKLEIPEDARRSSGAGRKCRCDKAKVLAIYDNDGHEITESRSDYDRGFVYTPGKTIIPDSFDEDRWNECSHGIHFFITRDEAENYYCSYYGNQPLCPCKQLAS